MRTLRILFAKELNATLTSPIGYTVAAVFLLVLGYTFSLTLFATKVANLQYIFHQIYVLSILLVPILTMRSFAEERRSETLELLLTAPVQELSIVLAKYAAPYLANSDVVLSALAWLTREERAPAVKPPIEVLPMVALTGEQMRGIFIVTVLLVPGLIAFAGGTMWWLRR